MRPLSRDNIFSERLSDRSMVGIDYHIENNKFRIFKIACGIRIYQIGYITYGVERVKFSYEQFLALKKLIEGGGNNVFCEPLSDGSTIEINDRKILVHEKCIEKYIEFSAEQFLEIKKLIDKAWLWETEQNKGE